MRFLPSYLALRCQPIHGKSSNTRPWSWVSLKLYQIHNASPAPQGCAKAAEDAEAAREAAAHMAAEAEERAVGMQRMRGELQRRLEAAEAELADAERWVSLLRVWGSSVGSWGFEEVEIAALRCIHVYHMRVRDADSSCFTSA